ncbi:MAG: ATP-dependent DNA helicase [Spirochaetaceae bacterium]
MIKVKISVRDLISFNSQEGSLGGTILTSSRAVIGTKEHKRIQESRDEDYLKEYSLKTIIESSGITLEVFGRADGIYSKKSPPVIEEIKTTTTEKTSDAHMAQVKLYAYLYLIENKLNGITLDEIGISLLYININNKEERTIEQVLSDNELKTFFNSFVEPYLKYLTDKQDWSQKRDDSLKVLTFPFKQFREGQREFSVNVYRSVRDSETLFARAPTGTGKSIAALFPALKAMGEGVTNKIFYLTAKTVGRITAREAVNQLRHNNTKIRSVVLTAKEKICIHTEYNCNPEVCPFARDYYKKLAKALEHITLTDDFYQDNLQEFGRTYNICPFELSLDISEYSDVIICDYNYVFDLRVHLKRYFDSSKQDFTLLIDEAHNLPDRLRGSYSCLITREDIPPLINITKHVSDRVTSQLEAINDLLLEYIKENPKEETTFNKPPEMLIKLLRKFTTLSELDLVQSEFQGKAPLLDWYFNALFFIKLSELYSEGHIFLQENTGGLGIDVEILCNDPSYLFTKMLLKSKSHIFFSATLNPLDYYHTLLLEEREFKAIDIPSPYIKEHLNVVIRSDIKTTYKERGRSYQQIADCINSAVDCKEGNYLVFFPSYSYMEEVNKLMILRDVHIQKPKMDETQRKDYIDKFHNHKNVIAFAIMGGVFGEGIDLVGDKLIGVIVVGVGLPQISLRNNLIKEYFQNKRFNGYNYAYNYPGFNKVMQAVGRVIRREEDKGIAILIDERFNTRNYRPLFPPEWGHHLIINSDDDMKLNIQNFWNSHTVSKEKFDH